MKNTLFITIFMTLCSQSLLFASERKVINCKVIKLINSNYLEESLNVKDYPTVTVSYNELGSKDAKLGINIYHEETWAKIEEKRSTGFNRIYTIIPAHKDAKYTIIVKGSPLKKTGKLFGQRKDKSTNKFRKKQLIALLKCR